MREDYVNGFHAVRERLPGHVDVEEFAEFNLVEFVKEFCSRQCSVSRNNRVCTFSADWE